jgi:prolyl-tRNA synthetase
MIQTGTSHFLGQNFSKMYNIKVQDKNNQFFPPYYTSHGTTQRMIGDIIVVHGDDKGIVMPFKLAAKQIIIGALNINENPKILELANSLKASLSNYRVKVDDTNNSFGFKIAESETLGTPFFVILGKRELENNTLTIVRRDTGEKISVAENEIVNKISELSVDYDKTLYTRAKKRMDDDIVYVDTVEEFEKQSYLNKIVLAP